MPSEGTVSPLNPAALAADAERAVLGAMLVEPACIERAIAALKPHAFYYRAHTKAFEAMCALRSRGEPVDLVTLVGELKATNELEAAGGPPHLAELYESATSGANLEAHARLVRAAYAVRERARIGQELANGAASDPTAARALLERLEEVEAEAEGSRDPAGEWAARSMSGTQLAEAAIPPLSSWLGNGLLPAGELAFLTGHSGVGKTFLTVQLMSALSIGHTFCGLATQRARVGLVELEMPWASVQSRIGSLSKGDPAAMAFLCEPPGVVHVSEPASRANLVAFCRLHALDVLILDPFNRIHDMDENSGSDMGHVLEGLHHVRRESGVAILVLHHVRKLPSGLPAGQHSRASSLDAGRGSSRLTNDPATVLALDETKGFVRLTFAKVRHAESPPSIYLKRNARGFFDVSEDPALAQVRRKDGLAQMLEKAGSDGVSAETAAEIFKVNVRTIRRDLEKLGAEPVPFGKTEKRWLVKADHMELEL